VNVLIVDDEPAVRDVITRWAAAFGLEPHSAANAEDALATLRTQPCDLAIVDVMMPGRDGLWLAEQLHRKHPQTAVVIATAYTELLDDERTRRSFADLLVKPFHRERFQIAVERGRLWHRDALADLQWLDQLNLEVEDGVKAIARDIGERMARGVDELRSVTAMATKRIPRTQAHSERVARFVRAMARSIGLDADTTTLFETAARFHDVGKAAMPMALLTKPCALTEGEEAIMHRHVDVGADLLAALPTLADAAPLVRATHEWFSGGGYPRALIGEAIPLASRMIAVADAYDAITQDRAYHHPVESAHAINELLRCCPTQFDPDVVDLFLRILSRH
jgi:response regulator RpfG family c-di-GMP phosphodiesterase